MLIRVAWRNLGRNKRRTLITGAGIALGASMCIGAIGVLDGLDAQIVSSVTDVDIGHVQVHAHDYLHTRALGDSIDPAHLVPAVEHTPHVVAVAPRIYGWGFAAKDAQSAGVQLMGIDPDREAKVTSFQSKLLGGSALPSAATPWQQAHPLTAGQRETDMALTKTATAEAIREIDNLGTPPLRAADDSSVRKETRALLAQLAPRPDAPLPALMGAGLAKKLRVHPGDTLDVISQDADGVAVDVEIRVAGTLQTSSEALDRTRIVLHWRDLQRMLDLKGRVHELAVRVDNPDRASEVAQALRLQPALGKLDVESWTQLRPDTLAIVAANDALSETLVFLIFLVAGLGVANTMLMVILERKREFGMLKALGMRPASIVGMVVAETVLLATVATSVGLCAGATLDELLLHIGLPVSHEAFSLAGANVNPVLRAAITTKGLVSPVVALIFMAVLASLYPAISASRVEPAVGMREL